jgi:hypothetical protein
MSKAFRAKQKAKATKYAAKKIYHVDVIEAVATDCLAAGFMADLDGWMQAHTEEFATASIGSDPTGESGNMYTMAQTAMHKEFTAFVDANMNSFVSKHKRTVQQFYELCAKVSNAAPQVQAFIDLLTASSEFPIFVDMMSNRERREYFFYIMRSWRMECALLLSPRPHSQHTHAHPPIKTTTTTTPPVSPRACPSTLRAETRGPPGERHAATAAGWTARRYTVTRRTIKAVALLPRWPLLPRSLLFRCLPRLQHCPARRWLRPRRSHSWCAAAAPPPPAGAPRTALRAWL